MLVRGRLRSDGKEKNWQKKLYCHRKVVVEEREKEEDRVRERNTTEEREKERGR